MPPLPPTGHSFPPDAPGYPGAPGAPGAQVTDPAGTGGGGPRPLLLFVVTVDWYFRSHRLPTARAAQAAGYAVAVATHVGENGPAAAEAIAAQGIRVIPLPWRRRSLNPLRAVGDVWRLARLYHRERPAIIHLVATKPAVLGGLAALLGGWRRPAGGAGKPALVTTLAGLGLVFAHDGAKGRLARLALKSAMRLAAWGRAAALVVQNRDDEALLHRDWPAPPPSILVPGSGVDLERFQPLPPPERPPGRPCPSPAAITCAQVSRMLTLKGVADVVSAVHQLREEGLDVRLLLAGTPDEESHAAIPVAQLQAWSRLPGIEWLGAVADVRTVWRRADIAVLASHGGEGVPKSLMEAAACARPLVATDVAGNREVARDGVNALLVPPANPQALAAALRRLAMDRALRQRLGAASRAVVDPALGDAEIGRRMRDIYHDLRGVPPSAHPTPALPLISERHPS